MRLDWTPILLETRIEAFEGKEGTVPKIRHHWEKIATVYLSGQAHHWQLFVKVCWIRVLRDEDAVQLLDSRLHGTSWSSVCVIGHVKLW